MQRSLIVLIAMILAASGNAYAVNRGDTATAGTPPSPAAVLAQADPGEAQAGGDPSSVVIPPSTTEIPANSTAVSPAAPDSQTAPDAATRNDMLQYENQEAPMPNVASLQEFMNQGIAETPIGVQVQEDCTHLQDHERICGLAVLDVKRNSPAALAGIKPYSALGRQILDGASIAAAVFFPPAIVVVGVVSQTHVGESFDLIIGVDGQRTRHLLDLQDLTANDKPGEVIYLMIVRGGKRIQIPVHLPPTYSAYTY